MIAKKTRIEKRKILENVNFSSSLIKLINHFFPLKKMLGKISDERHQSYVTYENHVIFMLRILMSVFHIKSMRKLTEKLNNSTFIKNFSEFCGVELDEIPHWNTVNNFLELVKPEEIENVIYQMARRLIRTKSFDNAKVPGKYWQIIIDGTQIYSSNKPLDEKSLKKNYRDENGNITSTIYSYYVLEAKIVLHEKIIVSIGSEFVENEADDAKKQDCELKAMYRLMEKIKTNFSKLPVCICADGLYAAEPVFRTCKEKYGREYIIRFKDGSIPTLFEEYENLKKYESNKIKEKYTLPHGKEVKYEYNYVNDTDYRGINVKIAECIEETDKKTSKFTFITSFKIKKNNISKICGYGRKRWKIENEGFNVQKNHGYEIEHNFSNDYNAQKNHYLLIQIAHTISQLFENSEKALKEFKMTLSEIHEKILNDFKITKIGENWDKRRRFQIRFFEESDERQVVKI